MGRRWTPNARQVHQEMLMDAPRFEEHLRELHEALSMRAEAWTPYSPRIAIHFAAAAATIDQVADFLSDDFPKAKAAGEDA